MKDGRLDLLILVCILGLQFILCLNCISLVKNTSLSQLDRILVITCWARKCRNATEKNKKVWNLWQSSFNWINFLIFLKDIQIYSVVCTWCKTFLPFRRKDFYENRIAQKLTIFHSNYESSFGRYQIVIILSMISKKIQCVCELFEESFVFWYLYMPQTKTIYFF